MVKKQRLNNMRCLLACVTHFTKSLTIAQNTLSPRITRTQKARGGGINAGT